MQACHLTHSSNPLLPLQNRAQLTLVAKTLSDALHQLQDQRGIKVAPELNVIHVNGVVVEPDQWAHWPIKPDDLINILTKAGDSGGGGDANKVVRSIVTIAVAAALVFMLVPPSQALMIGGMIGTALYPPDVPELTKHENDASPSYNIEGTQNRSRPYQPLAYLVGSHKLVPDKAFKDFTEFDENGDQYLFTDFNFGVGPMAIGDLHIGDTPLANYKEFEVYQSDETGALLQAPGNVDTLAGAALPDDGTFIQKTTSLNTTRIGIDLVGAVYALNSDNDTVSQDAQINIEYRPVGSATWISLIFDTVPVDQSHYWSVGVMWDDGEGTLEWYQDYYDSNPDTLYSPTGHTEGAVAFVEEWGDYSENHVWHWTLMDGSEPPQSSGAGLTPEGVTYSSAPYALIRNDDYKAVRRSYYRSVAKGQYEVRVNKLSPLNVANNNSVFADLNLTAIRSYQPDSANYAGQNRLGLRIKANGQLQGRLEGVNALCSSSVLPLIQSGLNYTLGAPIKGGNPAWEFLKFALGRRRDGATGPILYGAMMPLTRIDLASLYEWGVWCKTNALAANGIIDRKMSVGQVLGMIARCGRASATWSSGKLGVVWNAENQPPVTMFGMPNIVAGSFEVSYISDQLASEVEVMFRDAAIGYKPKSIRVSNPSTGNGETVRMELWGCSSETQASEEANLMFAEGLYHRRRIKWKTDMEGFVCQRGDVVTLSHDMTQWSKSGRLIAGTINQLTLDKPVPRTTANAEYITVRLPNGEMETVAVTANGNTETSVLTLSTPLSVSPDADATSPQQDYLWFFEPNPTPGKRVKITDIKPSGSRMLDITAIDEVPEYYAAKSGGHFTPVAPNYWASRPEVTAMTFEEIQLGVNESPQITVTFETQHADFMLLDVRTLTPGGNQFEAVFAGRYEGKSYSIKLPVGSGLRISATAAQISELVGNRQPALVNDYLVTGDTVAPNAVDAGSLGVAMLTDSTTEIGWTQATRAKDLAGYRIKWSSNTAQNWLTMPNTLPINGGLFNDAPAIVSGIPVGTVRFAVAAVDFAGNESVIEYATVVLSLPLIADGQVVWGQNVGGVDTGAVSGSRFKNLDFTDSKSVAHWLPTPGNNSAGQLNWIAGGAPATGGGYIQATGGTGWYSHDEFISITDDLIEIHFRLYSSSAGQIYLGWEGYDGSGARVNVIGVDTHGSQHYHAIAAVTASGWAEFKGYSQGRGSTVGTSGVGTLQNPGKFHPSVVKIRPVFVVNYPNSTGFVSIDFVRIRTIQTASDTPYSDGQTIDSLQPAAAGADPTSQNTAAAIANQGALATLGSVSENEIDQGAVSDFYTASEPLDQYQTLVVKDQWPRFLQVQYVGFSNTPMINLSLVLLTDAKVRLVRYVNRSFSFVIVREFGFYYAGTVITQTVFDPTPSATYDYYAIQLTSDQSVGGDQVGCTNQVITVATNKK